MYIDCYKLDGTLLYRIDLGVNIRAGAHYTQFLVYDFDGDGRAELMFKTAPGTKVIRYNQAGQSTTETYVTMPPEDIAAGYSHSDDYRMSSEDYYKHIVSVFMRWHSHEEVVAGRWPSTLEECFGIEQRYDYPLSRGMRNGSPITSSMCMLPVGVAATICGHSRDSFLMGLNI